MAPLCLHATRMNCSSISSIVGFFRNLSIAVWPARVAFRAPVRCSPGVGPVGVGPLRRFISAETSLKRWSHSSFGTHAAIFEPDGCMM